MIDSTAVDFTGWGQYAVKVTSYGVILSDGFVLDSTTTLTGYLLSVSSAVATYYQKDYIDTLATTFSTITVHNNMNSIQGGESGNYYHIKNQEYNTLQTATTTFYDVFGDTLEGNMNANGYNILGSTTIGIGTSNPLGIGEFDAGSTGGWLYLSYTPDDATKDMGIRFRRNGANSWALFNDTSEDDTFKIGHTSGCVLGLVADRRMWTNANMINIGGADVSSTDMWTAGSNAWLEGGATSVGQIGKSRIWFRPGEAQTQILSNAYLKSDANWSCDNLGYTSTRILIGSDRNHGSDPDLGLISLDYCLQPATTGFTWYNAVQIRPSGIEFGSSTLRMVQGIVMTDFTVFTSTKQFQQFWINKATASLNMDNYSILNSSRVGIGTGSPSQVLDVIGNIEQTGNITTLGAPVSDATLYNVSNDHWLELGRSNDKVRIWSRPGSDQAQLTCNAKYTSNWYSDTTSKPSARWYLTGGAANASLLAIDYNAATGSAIPWSNKLNLYNNGNLKIANDTFGIRCASSTYMSLFPISAPNQANMSQGTMYFDSDDFGVYIATSASNGTAGWGWRRLRWADE